MPDGTGANGVALLGDSPYIAEVAKGLPFQGPAGFYLNSILQKRHLDRHEFSIYNVAQQCRPPHLGWTDHPERYPEAAQASAQCRPYLDKFISERQPRALVAMGNVALRGLTGLDGIEQHHGYVNPSVSYGIPTVGTFHPSHIIQGAHKLTISFVLAIARALEIAQGSYRPTELQLFEDPSIELLDWYLGNSSEYLMCDIETPESQELDEEASEDDASYTIVRMGFSTGLGSGCSFPFNEPYIGLAKRVVRMAKLLLFWNKNYDLPRLRAAGFSLHPDVQIIDAMWLWHWIQSDLPKALAFAAPFFYSGPSWKHLAHKRPAYYNAMDNAIQTLCYAGCRDIAIREHSWDRFMAHCVRIEPILVRMGEGGVHIDIERRAKFMTQLQADTALALLQVRELVPAKLAKYKVWTRQPKRMEGVHVGEIEACHKDGTPVLTESGTRLMKPSWRKQIPFNPNSSPQLLELIKCLGLKPPRKRGEDRETTEAKYLERFGKKYPVFKQILAYKKRSKLISTYNWQLDGEGRVHTTYGFHPSTWRLSSRKSNLFNMPKRQELADLFRACIIAPPGHKLVEADSSAIEAVFVGYCAGSQSYINLAKAGVHGWLTSHIIGQPLDHSMPFDELQKQCKLMKRANPVVYEAAKRCIHGSNYLLSAYGMSDEYEEYFPTEQSAKLMQTVYFSSVPGQEVRAWHNRVLKQAHASKKLTSHYGYTHYFYEVFSYDRKSKAEVLGEDAKRAVAFVPQADAAGFQKEVLLWLADKHPWMMSYPRVPTYDSILCVVPDSHVDSVTNVLYAAMTRPIAEMNGLTVGVEIKVGQNLAPRTSENPEGIEEVHFAETMA